jgi:hypothetical protein
MSADLISAPGMRSPTGSSRPPRTVLNAARLMYASAAIELATLITILVTEGSVKAAVLHSHPVV